MKPRRSPEHQQVVHDLMERGWYHAAADPVHEGNTPDEAPLWRFCYGHLTDGAPRHEVLVQAASELEAMRALLAQLEKAEADLAVPG